MEEKKCRVCGKIKPLSEFGKAKSCSDGHYCTCKLCRYEQAKSHKAEMRKDPSYVEEERRKAREKYRRYKEEGRIKPSKTPNGMNVAIQLKRRGFDMTGKEAHHWNYNCPKSVFIMSRNAHEAIHRHLLVDYDSKMTYTKEGVLLETAEQAKEFFAKVLVSEGINEEIQYVDFSNNLSLIESAECRDIESFKKKAYEKFGNRFNYDKCEYKGYETPMLIYCDKHGYFEQSPNDHLRSRHGCPRCAVDSVISKEKYTTEEFIRKAKLKHGDRYTYDHTVYVGSRERVIVTCREHGDFPVFASFHLAGRGCQTCTKIEATRKMVETQKKNRELKIKNKNYG